VRFFDDSKATTPASVLAAVSGFPSVVLIAGGRNKGLDMGVLRQAGDRLRAVIAIGEAAPDVAAALDGVTPITTAWSMDDAVAQALDVARPGDAVLLSPGCASYDWYRSYGERGDDFRRAVLAAIGEDAE
jgi:UDP-N-acetylmuramoylalanine--D-glutamate ligase